jgi:hypothetical protein
MLERTGQASIDILNIQQTILILSGLLLLYLSTKTPKDVRS